MKTLVSIIIPAFNEANNLPLLAEKINNVMQPLIDFEHELIIVNDGSTDTTREVLGTLSDQYQTVHPLHMRKNSGQSAALLAGFRASRGAYLLTLDADLQNDPDDFPAFLKSLERYDCVCGYRAERNDTFLRRITSYFGNKVRRLIVDDGIRDAGCGIKGFRRVCIQHFVPFHGVHRFFAAMVRNGGLSISEIPVSHHPRLHGKSKYGLGNRLFWVLYDFFGVAWLSKRYLILSVEDPLDTPEL